MAVNYYVESNLITVDPNSLWGDADVTGDGSSDQGMFPLSMIIKPNLNYTVSAANFNIAGLTPSEQALEGSGLPPEIGGGFYVYHWNTDDIAGYVPQGVLKIRMWDTGTPGTVGNEIKVVAIVSPEYSIGNTDTPIVLDIDGDADWLYNTGELGDFSITLSMNKGELSNCTIVPFLPDYSLDSNIWSVSTSDPGTSASVFITQVAGGAQENLESITTGNVGIEYGGFTEVTWFWIIPSSPNFTLSRHNLKFDLSDTIVTDLYENGLNWSTGGMMVFGGGSDGMNSPYEFGDAIGYGGSDGWPSTGYTNVNVFSTSQTDNVTTSVNWGSVVDLSLVDNHSLIDIDGGNQPNIPYLNTSFNINYYPEQGVNPFDYPPTIGMPPPDYSPSDWYGNAVLVRLTGIGGYIPGANPPNLTFKIDGEAMLLGPGDTSSYDFNFIWDE